MGISAEDDIDDGDDEAKLPEPVARQNARISMKGFAPPADGRINRDSSALN